MPNFSPVRDPNHEMGLWFTSVLLEIALRWWTGSRFTDSDAFLELQQRRSSRPFVDVVYRRDDGDHVVEKKI